MFQGKGYNNQERPNISHIKVLATCVAILDAHPNTIRSINEMLRMSVNIDQIRANNRAACNLNSHQLEQLFSKSRVEGTFHDTVFNIHCLVKPHKSITGYSVGEQGEASGERTNDEEQLYFCLRFWYLLQKFKIIYYNKHP